MHRSTDTDDDTYDDTDDAIDYNISDNADNDNNDDDCRNGNNHRICNALDDSDCPFKSKNALLTKRQHQQLRLNVLTNSGAGESSTAKISKIVTAAFIVALCLRQYFKINE